jgi:hypothetical protein
MSQFPPPNQWPQHSQPLPTQPSMHEQPQYSQQQAPMMQPGPQPSKKPSRSRFLFVLAIILVLIAVGSGIAAIGSNHKTTTTAGQPPKAVTLTASAHIIATGIARLNADLTAQALTPTTPPDTPTPASMGIGTTQSSGSWSITINSMSTSQGDQYDTPPKSGDIYLLINFTGNNTGSSNLDMSPVYFTLRDEQGNTYDIAYITVPHDPRGTVVAGQQIRGDLSYEIPQSIHQYILQFDSPPDFDYSQVVQWNLTV